MVVGNGLIAKGFNKINHSDLIVFASGVANSKLIDELEFMREENLLRQYLNHKPHLKLIYFSTYSVDDHSVNSSAYVKHKLKMEKIVSERNGSYLIVRTSNLVGDNSWNSTTIFNFLFQSVSKSNPIEIWANAVRNLLDIDHLVQMVDHVISEVKLINTIIYLVNPLNVSIDHIVDRIEEYLGKTTEREPKFKGSSWFIDVDLSEKCFQELKIDSTNYISALLVKYYSKL